MEFCLLVYLFVGRTPTYSQDNTNRVTRTDIHASSRTRSHDISIALGENSACLRPRAATVIGI
jgi:hypothetical protein